MNLLYDKTMAKMNKIDEQLNMNKIEHYEQNWAYGPRVEFLEVSLMQKNL